MKEIPLHALGGDGQLVARIVEYPEGTAGALSEAGQSLCSVVYVLEGQLNVEAGGMHEVLETGDCAYVDSDMAMAWSAGASSRCRALVVTPSSARRG